MKKPGGGRGGASHMNYEDYGAKIARQFQLEGHPYYEELVEIVATAVKQAVEEEREACAELVLNHGKTEGKKCYYHNNQHWRLPYERFISMCWQVIEQDIRERGR